MSEPRRPDASMSLLTDLRERSLEPSYAAAAERRAALGLPPRSTRSPLVVLAAVALGVLLTVAGQALRSSTSLVSQTRDRLMAEIVARQKTGDDQAAELDALQRDVAAARAAALGSQLPGVLAMVSRLEVSGGYAAVIGPGLLVTLDDAADTAGSGSDPRSGTGFDSGRVSAADLQIVVNGLWQAGAEAISVNGQRLTSHAAIRFAGQAIIVDFRPLTTPYEITAIGDPSGLPAAFAATPAGSYLKGLEDNYGIRAAVESRTGLTCPAGAVGDLTYTRAVPDGIPSTSAPTASTTTGRPTAAPTTGRPTATASTKGGRP